MIGEPHAVLFDMRVIKEHGIRFGHHFYVIDIDFYSKVQRHGDVYQIAETLSAFRVSKGSASVQLLELQALLFRKFVEGLRDRGDYEISTLDYLLFRASVQVRSLMKAIFYRLFI